ncbi:aminobenzoyl-glutamate transport protein [Cyclonatronum proteinivorum]|uniref:Aminobenzoyl-glutamate transport protein n=1 Tax=Cyclonatronum proteinivorum TaxID=1457365 RepID=A0A345UHV5_9BACT|nr:AbgT family transporter [Cyclonatronum proteinivorum]AXJ00057.1 aminobenzoyl-glutamate transport protein [Cyclonatronum proteinivorum]
MSSNQGSNSSGAGNSAKQSNWFTRFLNAVEWLGNLLPHPVTLFALFCAGVILISGLAELLSLSVEDPRPEGTAGRSPDGIISAVSLMNAEGLRRIIANLVTNFTGFAPLGTVLVALLGVGVAEHSGLIKTAIRGIVLKALSIQPTVSDSDPAILRAIKKPIYFVLQPKILVTFAIVFSGIVSNTASELGYVVLVPLGAVVFYSLGRHPLAGMAAAFAGVSGGYSANLLLGTIDPLLAGLTQEAAQLIDPTYEVHAAVNYYFMFMSVFVISTLGTWVTVSIVEPKLGPYDPAIASEKLDATEGMEPLTDIERKGLFWTFISVVAMFGVLALMVIPEWGVLRNPDPNVTDFPATITPFLNGIVALIFIGFIIPGVVFGKITGSITSERDVIDGMAKSMSTLGLYIVIVFFAAQFVAYFGWTNLGQILAVNGANFLEAMNLTGPLVFVFFIFISGFVNLMLGSASAQWAVTAPIFVPMLMLIGYSPEVIQAAYRIGDSVTNIITPMMSYFGLILAFATKYDRNLGIGTIISMMLPYSIMFLLGWIALFYVMIFMLGFPPGPGAEIYFDISTR